MLPVSPVMARRECLVPSCLPLSLPPLFPVIFSSLCASHAASPSRTLLGLPATFLLTFASIPPISPASKGQRLSPEPAAARLGGGGALGTEPGGRPVACARQPLPPSACAQPRPLETGLFKGIVQRLVQCLPPSGSRSWAALPRPASYTLPRENEDTKSAGAGRVGGRLSQPD